MDRLACIAAATTMLLFAAGARAQRPDASDWGFYGGDIFGQHYSNLAEINRDTVSRLRVAWMHRTGELGGGFAQADALTFEATPVLAFGMLYASTATDIVMALDPASGRELWRFDPHIDRRARYAQVVSRGVAVWQDANPASGACTRRVFIGTLDARLIALDALTGSPCTAFGVAGAVDLTRGLRIYSRADYLITSPPAIHRDVVVIGSAIGDNRALPMERGVIRAFDARSGALRWSFDPLPDSATHPAAGDWHGDQAARAGGANSWAVMSVDPARGLVFVPTGGAGPAYYGGGRLGNDGFANSLLALDTNTGRVAWHQQLVHHDLWDFDLAAQPALVELDANGRPLYAVLEATKSGLLFAFERDTGKAIYPIGERAVPRSAVPGEQSSPTQPFPQTPAFTPLKALDPRAAWGLTFWDRGACRDLIERSRNEGVFTPPDLHGSISVPGASGGVNWGGLAVDVRRERVFAAVNRLPWLIWLVRREDLARVRESSSLLRHAELVDQGGTPYVALRAPLLSPWGLPCTPPPWGTLASIDLRTNRTLWEVPLGSSTGLGMWFTPARDFGTPGAGGPIVTAGDLVFVGAATDGYFRAFDSETGREMWKYHLPAGGQATPMTYRAGKTQRQYVLIAAGGHGLLAAPRGDYLIAFALPEGRTK